MSHYETTPGQRKYLRRKFAADKDLDRCCDCPGCNIDGKVCEGFVRGCKCDEISASDLHKFRR